LWGFLCLKGGLGKMGKEVVIIIAEDDLGHFVLTKRYLEGLGLCNEIVRLADGQEALDFFYRRGGCLEMDAGKQYVLMLDIRMPGIDGVEVLETFQNDEKLKDVPVIMLTTTNNPHEIERCYKLGCSAYIVKPVKYSTYIDAMRKVGLYPSMVQDGVKLISKCPA
jgi:CheY-like chemotaxis protein